MAKVLVIIVSWNAKKWIRKCLNSVEGSSLPADVLLIDNGSTDGTLTLVRKEFPAVRILEMEDNLPAQPGCLAGGGYAGAAGRGP